MKWNEHFMKFNEMSDDTQQAFSVGIMFGIIIGGIAVGMSFFMIKYFLL